MVARRIAHPAQTLPRKKVLPSRLDCSSAAHRSFIRANRSRFRIARRPHSSRSHLPRIRYFPGRPIPRRRRPRKAQPPRLPASPLTPARGFFVGARFSASPLRPITNHAFSSYARRGCKHPRLPPAPPRAPFPPLLRFQFLTASTRLSRQRESRSPPLPPLPPPAENYPRCLFSPPHLPPP